ncbi:hypothetical protein GCM10009754_10350 [Amycolatopsis minnesotensis]|uniref:DUF222 domain-containing protein n=2 Tax=Amycolatopsis minnesotensis TaxID=337894 RepID=A0ABN2Q5A3_9PSEU
MEMVALAASRPESPNRSGGRADLIVTIPLADLKRELGAACLDMVTDITASEARILACDCKVIPAILDGAGQPLAMGRARRLVTEAIRLMLAIRDRGCCFPGARGGRVIARRITCCPGTPVARLTWATQTRMVGVGPWRRPQNHPPHPRRSIPSFLTSQRS